MVVSLGHLSRSLPSRGAWIEINVFGGIRIPQKVAPLAGSVDRNVLVLGYPAPGKAVAPLAGSVDRNLEKAKAEIEAQGSLPSRGAWIEIVYL